MGFADGDFYTSPSLDREMKNIKNMAIVYVFLLFNKHRKP